MSKKALLNGWKTASKKPVANQNLWQQLDALCQQRDVDWHWVKGHAGHAGNEKADELANLGVTSSSEDLSARDAQEMAKKKEQIMPNKSQNTSNQSTSNNDDWLKYDPLGLDIDDELDEEALDEEVLNDEPFNNPLLDEQSHDNASKPMSTTDMPESQTMTTDTIMNNDNPDTPTDEPKFDGDTSRANPYFKPSWPVVLK